MNFWDTSAICALLLTEVHSPAASQVFNADSDVAVWSGALVESQCAIWGAQRRGKISADLAQHAARRLDEFAQRWSEIHPSEELRREAVRAVRVHDIPTGDGFQLAAALHASRQVNQPLGFVRFDIRLAEAARREGLTVISTR